MAKSITKIDYDEESDSLFLNKGKKVKASLEIGDFIIDIDNKGLVAGVEILNASKYLNLTKEKLKKIKEVKWSIKYGPNWMVVGFVLRFKKEAKERITIPVGFRPPRRVLPQ